MNLIEQFMIGLGFSVDTKGLDQMRAKVESARSSMLSWGAAITTSLVSAATLEKVAELGSHFEQNKIQIAGFLSALGQSSDFNAGLNDAAAVMQKITVDAAKLPGEAEEYIEVFKTAFPVIKAAMPGASLAAMTDFSNKLAAYGKSQQLDAGTTGRELNMLLGSEGRAGSHIVLWQRISELMPKLAGGAKITAQAFNQMSQPKRLELMQAALVKLQPMLDASADSFDAMWGTLVSTARQLTRLGTEGLFGSMKKGISELSSQFIDADGNLTKTGKDVVDVMSRVGKVVGAALDGGVRFVKWLAEDDAAASTLSLTLKALAAMVLGLGGAVALVAQDLWGYFNGMDSVTGMLVDKWAPAIYAVVAALVILTGMFSPLLLAVGAVIVGVYELKAHWQEVLDFVQGGLNGWVNVLNKVIDALNVVNRFLGADNDHLIKKIGGFHFADVNRDSEFAQATLGPGGGVLAPSFGPQPGGGMLWQPDFSMVGAGGTVNHGDLHVGAINITAPDAKAAGDEVVRRLARTNQSGLVR